MSKFHILVVDDEPDIRELVQDILQDEGYEVSTAQDAESARQARRIRRPDLVLLDIWMPDTDGISLLKEWSETEGTLGQPVIMMSGHGTVETAVEATRLGAYDFLEKPLSMAKLNLTVKRALENVRLQEENIGLRVNSKLSSEPIGRGPVMQTAREQAKRIAAHDTPVLILGESGCGKEVFARYMHAQGPRRAGAFTRVSVAGLTSGDFNTELFGAEEGTSVHYGSLERANGGTLFLEDIADMDLGLQAKILGAMRDGAFLRVGGVDPVEFNARVMAATSRDLAAQVESGNFREDLFYQLNVVPLKVPPLREHKEDIPELLEYYTDKLVNQEGMSYRRFSVAAQNRLRNYHWPGNIRELENIVQRLFILGSEPEVSVSEIELALGQLPRAEANTHAPNLELPLREAREQFEKSYIEHQIRLADGAISQVAKAIGMERTHLYRKLKSLGIDPKKVVTHED